jgi:hypothetical protein
MNEFDPIVKLRKVRRAGGKLTKLEKGGRTWKKADELTVNVSRYHRREANIYSIEYRTEGETGGCGRVSRRRSQRAEWAIGRKND